MKKILFIVTAALVLGSVAAAAPQFVVGSNQTIVASAIVTDVPFNADPTGVTDSTGAIQWALNVVKNLGGGTVFIPAGRYRIDGNLTVWYSVTLQGDGSSPDGTVLLASAGRGNPAAAPFIYANNVDGGLVDLSIYYPEQTPDNIQPYPPTIKVYMAATLRNVLLCNSYNGIEFEHYNASVLENVRGTVLDRGILVPFSSEFGWMRDVDFSNTYWEEAVEAFEGVPMSAADRETVGTFTRQNLTGLELQRLDGLAIDGFSADDAMLPVFMQPNAEHPNNVFGLGGVVYDFPEARTEEGWAAWYYGMPYGNLDHVPEVNGRQYAFAPIPMPARTDVFLNVKNAPYSASGDGITDDTTAIQQALTDAGALGGGTVCLQQGVYKVTAPLTVPNGVELRGMLGTGRVREYDASICVLEFAYGHDTPNPLTDPAQITLGSNAGVRGFTISCPLQSYDVTKIKPYPYTIRGNGSGTWVVDMVLVNSWFGIDLASNRNDGFLVRDIWGTVYHKGIDVGGGSVGGKLERTAFSYGVLLETRPDDPERTEETMAALRNYVEDNALYYSFGASSNLSTWGIVGFLPETQCLFYEQNGQSTQDAEFWMSMFDVAKDATIQAEQGGDIRWFGLFATCHGNWLQADPGFAGPLTVYGKTIYQLGQTSPLDFTQAQAHWFDEVSLTTGKAAPGSNEANALDRNPRTWWEAPAGSVLEVDLGAVMDIDRFDVESALFENAVNKINRAELHVSTNGTDYVLVAVNATPHFWMNMPITKTPARYVRLVAQSPAGTLKVAGFNLFNTSSTVRPVVALSPVDPTTLQWASWPGHTYSVWHTDSLTNGFTEVAAGIPGTGATLEIPAPGADLYDAAFYRLKANSED